MNFIKLLKKLEAYSLSLPYVNEVNLGDIYEFLNGKPNVKYASVNIDINNSVRNDNLISYSVYLYYIDRLTEDKSNWMEVKTTAELTLNSIINYAAKIGDVNDGWTINYFEQQFADYCAGGYVQFNLEVPNEMGECLIDEYEEGEIIYPDFPEHRIIDDDVIAKDKTWSSNKINSEIEAHSGATYTAGQNITIDASNAISADGYVFDTSDGSFATKYRQDEDDGGQELANTASGLGAVAEGYNTQATGNYGSHTEGLRTQATGECAHAEGYETQATGNFGSHAEGYQTLASNQMGHAEGYGTKATGNYGAHAEGYLSEANEQVTHAEGRSIVNGRYGHGEGYKTEVKNYAEHAQGRQNVSHTDVESSQTYNNPKRTIHSIGIGTRDSNHLNAVEVMTNGDYYLYGIGGYDGVHIKYETGYENTKTLQEYIASLEARISALEGNTTIS